MNIRFHARDRRADITTGGDAMWSTVSDFFVTRRNALEVAGVVLTPEIMREVLDLSTAADRAARLANLFVGTGQAFDYTDFRQLLLDLARAAPQVTGQIISSGARGPSLRRLVLDPATGPARAYETSGDIFLRTRADPAERRRVLEARILAHPAYLVLDAAAQQRVRDIISFARSHSEHRGEAHYYLNRLLLLLNTPNAPAAATAAMQTQAVAAGAERAHSLSRTTEDLRREERASADPSRSFTTVTASGERADGQSATFAVDATDVRNIVVRVRVHINASAEQRASIHAFEDLIERHLGGLSGFTVDLQFVDASGSDVVEVSSDPTGWTDAGNWVGDPNGLAHELMHILGLDDEYDYIEVHSANRSMPMATRLHWFTVEMRRTLPADGPSGIMSNPNNPPLHRHACAVARVPDIDRCVATRRALTPPARTGVRVR